MFDKLPDLLKEVVIMGGNYKGVGNHSMAAEFNFLCDPTAAHIVLTEFICPKILVTYELSKFEVEISIKNMQEYVSQKNKKSQFMKTLLEAHLKYHNYTQLQNRFCDAVAMVVALDRDVVTKTHSVYGTVELHGEHTKGMCVFDWLKKTKNEPNLSVVGEVNESMYQELFLKSIQ